MAPGRRRGRCWAALPLAALLLVACAERRPPEPAVELRPVSFAELPGWGEDDPSEAIEAFRRSCAVLARRDPGAAMGREAWAGTIGDWAPVCAAAGTVAPGAEAARAFLEQHLAPAALTDRGEAEGLFTGYYEPLLLGSRSPDARFNVPLHRRPADLVAVDLGEFDDALKGKRIAGRVADGRLRPYPDRAEIDRGGLAGKGLELLWVDDAIDKFFLQIQGSGLVELPDGQRLRIGYADQNGRAYRAIGRDLVEMGELTLDEVSLQTIRAWLRAHPERAPALMANNPSYVFFRELGDAATTAGPLGAQNVALTPERSIAVDPRFVPLGAPLWLDTSAPVPGGDQPLRRLVIAQDTGGAIKGPVRGDVFWGTGERAEHIAGHMRSRGRWFVLLPRALAPTG
jgi:membrane-bound lytic murein transglycosylase A